MAGILKVDELWSTAENEGIKLKSTLTREDGTTILTPAGDVSINFDDLADDQLSGNVIHGGIISNFRSIGIQDNASNTVITIHSNELVEINGYLQLSSDGIAFSGLDAGAPAGTVAYVTDDGGNLFYKASSGWRTFTARPGSSAAPITSSSDFAGGQVIPGTNWFSLNGQTFEAYVTDSFAGGSGWWVRCNYSATTWEYNAGGGDGPNHWNVTNSTSSGRTTFELTDAQINAIKTITSAAWVHFSRGCYGSVGWSYNGGTPNTYNGYPQFKFWDNSFSGTATGSALKSNLTFGGGTAWSTSASGSDCDINDTTWRREEYYIYANNSAGIALLPPVDYANNDTGDASERSRIYGADSQCWFKVG